MSDVETIRKEALQIAQRIQRQLSPPMFWRESSYRGSAGTPLEDDALALAERVIKLEELDKKFDVSDAG